jgi:serine/threonine protein kinase
LHFFSQCNRLEELNDEFTVFMDQRKGDSIVSHMTGTARTVATQATQFKEDGPSGRPFSEVYKLGDALGEGGFAQVYRCTHKRTGFVYAVKDINTEGLSAQEKSTLRDEIVVLKYLRGAPFIVRLYDVFKEAKRTYLILEEMKGGDLLNRICEKEVYTELEARELCQYFFEAIAYCHQKKIAHRDIKLDNLLLMVSVDASENAALPNEIWCAL